MILGREGVEAEIVAQHVLRDLPRFHDRRTLQFEEVKQPFGRTAMREAQRNALIAPHGRAPASTQRHVRKPQAVRLRR